MSYDIQLFRKEVKEKHRLNETDDFFENEENLLPFTDQQKAELKERLSQYDYVIESESDLGINYGFSNDEGVSALLTDNCLYFSATGEGVFEIGMTASEFTDTDEFAKYDPQADGWEEID